MKHTVTILLIAVNLFSYGQDYDYARLLGGVAGDARGQSIKQDNAGNLFMKGVFSGGLRVGTALYQASPEDAFFCKNDINGNFQWFKQVGFTNIESSASEGEGSMALDGSNNVYIIGTFFNDASIEGNDLINYGSGDIYIIKYDQNGNLIWVRNIGGDGNDTGNGIAIDAAGGVYITGSTRSLTFNFDGSGINTGIGGSTQGAYFARLNPDGTDDWIKFRITSLQQNEMLDALHDGTHVYVTGRVARLAFVGKYDATDGEPVWEESAVGSGTSTGHGIGLSGSTIYIAGEYRFNDLQFGAGPAFPNLGGDDSFLATFDVTTGTAGPYVVQSTIGDEKVTDLSITGSPAVISLTGSYTEPIPPGLPAVSGASPYVAVFNSSLVIQSAAGMVSAGNGSGLGIDSNFGDDAIYVTGTFDGQADVGGDVSSQKYPTLFIKRYELSSAVNTNEVFGIASPKGQLTAEFMEIDPSDNIYIAGYFDGTVDLLGQTLVGIESSSDEANPLRDIFIAKLNPDGSLNWVTTAAAAGDDLLFDLTFDANGYVYFYAHFNVAPNVRGINLPPGSFGDMIIKLDPDGLFEFESVFDFSGQGGISTIKGDQSGENLFIGGNFLNTITIQGNPLTSIGSFDFFLARMDASGNISAADLRSFGGFNSDNIADINLRSGSSTIWITGLTNGDLTIDAFPLTGGGGGTDLLVVSFDNSLTATLAFLDGGFDDQEGNFIDIDASDNIFIAGGYLDDAVFSGNPLSGTSEARFLFTVSYQSDGTFRWVNRITTLEANTSGNFNDLSVDNDGNVYLIGQMSNSGLSVEGNDLENQGDNDAFFVQYDNAGNYIFSDRFGSPYTAAAESYSGYEFGLGVAANDPDHVWFTGTLTVKPGQIGMFTLEPPALDKPGTSVGMNSYLARYITSGLPPEQPKIYWTEESFNQINRSNLDGSNFEQYYSGFSIFPQGIAYYGNASSYIYWTDTNGKVRKGRIGPTGFTNGPNYDVINESSTGQRTNLGVTVDQPNGKVYWASSWDGSIKVADIYAPIPNSTIQQLVTGLDNPRGIAINTTAGKMYYTENIDPGPADNLAQLHEVNMDGTNDIVVFSEQVTNEDYYFNDVKLDLANGRIYWSGGSDEDLGQIYVADLSDIPGTTSSFTIDGQPMGIDLDIAGGKIYWVNKGLDVPDPPIDIEPSISRANLDGSNEEALRQGSSENIFIPNFLVLDLTAASTTLSVVTTNPSPNLINVNRDSNIEFEFSQNIDAGTIDINSIVIQGEQTGLIQGAFNVSGSFVSFNPDNDFRPGEIVNVLITTNVTSVTADPILSSYSFSFVAAAGPSEEIPAFFRQGASIATAFGIATGVFAIDMDFDGDMDLLGVAASDDRVSWFENDGNQNFTENVIATGINEAKDVEAADIDKDGDIDVVTVSTADDRVIWYENDGALNFTTHVISSTANGAFGVHLDDINGDGHMDVLSASALDNKIAWYENDGSQSFTVRIISTSTLGALQVTSADLDGDNDIDVLAAAESGNSVFWYENDGTAIFVQHILSTNFNQARDVSTIDLDQDGDLDVLTASEGDDKIAWFENDGAQNFTEHVVTTLEDAANSVLATDLDGDGDLDLMSTGLNSGNFTWFENDGSQNFTRIVIVDIGIFAIESIPVDLDSDGDLDIVGAWSIGDQIVWFENTVSVCPLLPTVDAGLDQLICSTNAVALNAVLGGSATGATWTSSGTGTFDDDTSPTAVYTPSASDETNGTVTLSYTVAATATCPQASDDVVITFAQPITAANLNVNASVQQHVTIDFIGSSTINTGDVITVTILLNPTKGTTVINTDNTIGYTANTGTVGADTFQYRICNQCSDCSDGTVAINILNAPPIVTVPPSPFTTLAGQTVTIPFSTFIADLNDNIDTNSIQIVTGPTSGATATFDSNFDLIVDYSSTPFAGTDQLTVEVCDLLASCVTAIIEIEVDGEITAFNGISPNGDGLNDFFLIQNIQFLEPDNKVSIYNRWGDRVFEMNDYDPSDPAKRFEGKQNNGEELPNGVYFYKVSFISSREDLTGYLTLKR